VTGWISTPEGAFYTTAPQYVAADFAAFLAGIDRDGDGLICRQVGVLNDGRPPFVWPGYPPVSFIDDAIRH
jgi:hypothetical protein